MEREIGLQIKSLIGAHPFMAYKLGPLQNDLSDHACRHSTFYVHRIGVIED